MCCSQGHIHQPNATTGLVTLQVRIIWSFHQFLVTRSAEDVYLRLSRKVRIVVTIIGTRFLSARALASRSTPKVCSAMELVMILTEILGGGLVTNTINGVIVVVIDLDMGYKSPCPIVFQ